MTQKQRERIQPPTASEARRWYRNGWIDEDTLEELLENAIDHYGGGGENDFFEAAQAIIPRTESGEQRETNTLFGDETLLSALRDLDGKRLLDELLKAALWMYVGAILYALFIAANQPPAGTLPL